MNSKERVELHLHTRFSAMDALTDVDDLISRAAQEIWPAVAITDYGNVQAFPEAQQAAQKLGVKVIYGLEADYFDDIGKTSDEKNYKLVLLARNKTGLKNLYKLVSYLNTNMFEQVPCIPRSILDKYRDGLLVGSPSGCGEVFDAILSGKTMRELESIVEYYDYLELQPVCNNRLLISNGTIKSENDLRQLNIHIAELAKLMNKTLIAAGDVRFLDPEDQIVRSILLNAKGIKSAADSLPLYYNSTDEMLAEFSYLGEDTAYAAVVANTIMIADSIESIVPVPSTLCLPKINAADDEIAIRSITQAEKLYGKPLPSLVKNRLDWELSCIKNNGFEVFFAVASRLVKRSEKNDYSVSFRSFVAASLVAYLLGITDINPMSAHYICDKCKHSKFDLPGTYVTGFELPNKLCPVCKEKMRKDGFNIPAETFFAEDGSKIPVFDLVFADAYRKQAVEHLKEIFGQSQVIKAGIVRTISESAALVFVHSYAQDNNIQFSENEIDEIVSKLCCVKFKDVCQPNGYYVIPDNFEATDFCPVGKCSDDYIALFNFCTMHGCIIEFNILGHETLTILKELEAVTETNSRKIPLDDRKTLQLFEAADTAGLPTVGSGYARFMLMIIMPTSFSELIKISGLCHGTGTWNENAEYLIQDETVSINELISTRDDIFLYLTGHDMDRGEAYDAMEFVRKGRFCMDSQADQASSRIKQCAELEEKLRQHNVPDWYIDSMKKIRYLFPKAHAVARTLQIYRLAWYKAHYPQEFFSIMAHRELKRF